MPFIENLIEMLTEEYACEINAVEKMGILRELIDIPEFDDGAILEVAINRGLVTWREVEELSLHAGAKIHPALWYYIYNHGTAFLCVGDALDAPLVS